MQQFFRFGKASALSLRAKIAVAIPLTALAEGRQGRGLVSSNPMAMIHTAAFLQIVADVSLIASSIYACYMLGRAAWKLKLKSTFQSTAWILALVALAVCSWLVIDMGRLMAFFRHDDLYYLMLKSVVSLVVAVSVWFLAPLWGEVADCGLTSATEHENFLVLSEISNHGVCLMTNVHDSANRIVDFKFSYINSHAERLLFRRNEDITGKRLSDILPQLKANGILWQLRHVTETTPYEGDFKETKEYGTGIWVTLRAIRTHDGLSLVLCDRSTEHEKSRRNEELYSLTQSLIKDAPFSIIAVNPTGIVTAMNSAAEQLTKYRQHELTGKHSLVLLHDNAELSAQSYKISTELGEQVTTGFETLTAMVRKRKIVESEWTYICKDGSRVAVHVALSVLRSSDGKVTGYLAVAFDISERKKLNDSITFLAHHDALTKLPNRLLLSQRMVEAVEFARALDQQVTVMMLDIDHFKRINDSLGHASGDELLVIISERLLEAVRKTDTVARVGGDEFVVLLPNSGTHHDTLQCVKRILEKIKQPIMIAGRELTVTASVGVCIYPERGAEPDSLLRNADAAMYAAKDSGRNAYQLFSETMLEANADRLEMETDLRHALERRELFLLYQQQIDCKTQAIVGIEALVRWNHPTRGLVMPGDFIPAAEDCGLILPIGQWVLQRACAEAREMQLKLGYRFTVAVNLSPRQFLQSDLADIVEEALASSGLNPRDLELEITEYTLMISSNETSMTLGRLRKLGVRIAIDDFGTGFSSFKYILEYEVDRLKIDRSFIAKCPTDANASAIVRAVIAMAHGLQMKVVAEGVETMEQFDFLKRRRCDEAQGYLFGKPMGMTPLLEHLAQLEDVEETSQEAMPQGR